MEKAGADLIEIGIPFSDPIAEGIVIQEADLRALKSGTTTDSVFDMVADLRKEHELQLLNYLAASKKEVGLLINFGHSVQVRRKVMTHLETDKSV